LKKRSLATCTYSPSFVIKDGGLSPIKDGGLSPIKDGGLSPNVEDMLKLQ
jgi:hypothetical protein